MLLTGAANQEGTIVFAIDLNVSINEATNQNITLNHLYTSVH